MRENSHYSSRSHLIGISWYVPSGNVRLIVIGRMLALSSFNAMSMGLEKPSETSTSMGAPMDIWRALAPTIRAFSKRVSLGGPIKILARATLYTHLAHVFIKLLAFFLGLFPFSVFFYGFFYLGVYEGFCTVVGVLISIPPAHTLQSHYRQPSFHWYENPDQGAGKSRHDFLSQSDRTEDKSL